LEADGHARRAAETREALSLFLHVAVFAEPAHHFGEDARGVLVRRMRDAVVHPLALAPRRDEARTPQVREVARNLRLVHAEHLHEEADADLARRHQVQEAQTRPVGQRPEEQFHLSFLLRHPQSTPAVFSQLPRRGFAAQAGACRATRP
jgi:hypothetical protein